MSKKLTKSQFEYQKESIEQEIRGIDLQILNNKKTIKSNDLKASEWDIKKSEEGIRKSKIAYEIAKTSNDIQQEKLLQQTDLLKFEKFGTENNRKQLAVNAESLLLSLAQSQQDLEDAKELFQLKYSQNSSFQLPRLKE